MQPSGLTWRTPPIPYEQSFSVMREALENGVNFWDAGELYGPVDANSLQLLRAYFTKYPEDARRVILNVKGAFSVEKFLPQCDEEGITRSINNCLQILDGTKSIDIFQCARVDPRVSIEDTVRCMARFVRTGQIGAIGLSQVNAEQIRRATKVHPIAAVEVRYSLICRQIERNGVMEACSQFGIPIITYSPLQRGLLTELGPPSLCSFALTRLALTARCTAAQLALGWLTAQATVHRIPAIIPLPGATTVEAVKEYSRWVQLPPDVLTKVHDVMLELAFNS